MGVRTATGAVRAHPLIRRFGPPSQPPGAPDKTARPPSGRFRPAPGRALSHPDYAKSYTAMSVTGR